MQIALLVKKCKRVKQDGAKCEKIRRMGEKKMKKKVSIMANSIKLCVRVAF